MDGLIPHEPFCEVAGIFEGDDDTATSTKTYVFSLVSAWRFKGVECAGNFVSNRGTLWPPFGYAASADADAPFVADAFMNAGMFCGTYLFRAASVPVAWEGGAIAESERARIRAACLVRVADVSPRPPRLGSAPAGGDWVEALGAGGSVGLGFAADPATGEDEWFVRVHSGLSPSTMDEFEEACLAAQASGVETYGSVASTLFAAMERLAEFNARRIACAFAECCGNGEEDDFVLAGDLVACAPFEVDAWVGEAPAQPQPPSTKIPAWYVTPAPESFPLGAALLAHAPGSVATHAKHVAPCVASVWGTMRLVHGDVFVYVGCGPAEARVALADTPSATKFRIAERGAAPPPARASRAPAHVALPRVTPGSGSGSEKSGGRRCFWLGGEARNANLDAEYGEVAAGAGYATRFVAAHHAVRVSAVPGRGARFESFAQRLGSALLISGT